MTNQYALAKFTGFTEREVRQLCERYHMSFEQTKDWYDGYNVNGVSIYNPRSVTSAMMNGIFDSYWTQTETYEALKMYIVRNENGLRDKIVRMIAGEHISINTKTFQNDMCTFETADDILTLLVHLGYLTYDFDTKTAWIPNKEVRQEFLNSIQGQEFQNVNNAIHRSDKLLQLTLAQNAEKVAEMLQEVHCDNCSVIQYNDENSLACVLSLAYYSAQDSYAVYRELQGGEGFADLVFVPRTGNHNPAMIVELKWNQTAGIALEQIKDRLPDIIISDVMMPRMNGFELCREVKTNLDISHIPFILLTAYHNSQNMYTGYKTGADAFLPKPFEIDGLLALIHNQLRQREQIRARYKDDKLLTHKEVSFSNADETFLLKLNSLIADNMSNPELDVAFLATNMCISRSLLFNKVKAITGMGIVDYVNKQRIERSIVLLTTTTMNITEISEVVGFSSLRYFSKVFKSIKGEIPSAYRKQDKVGGDTCL